MMSMQVKKQTTKKSKSGSFDLFSNCRTINPPQPQIQIEVHSDADKSRTTGTVDGTCLLVSPAVVDLGDGKTMI